MTRRSFTSFIGLAGVADDERPRARRWGQLFEVPMLLIALWIITEWYLSARGAYPERIGKFVTNWIVWLFFVSETAFC